MSAKEGIMGSVFESVLQYQLLLRKSLFVSRYQFHFTLLLLLLLLLFSYSCFFKFQAVNSPKILIYRISTKVHGVISRN
jgi:hypothetical protein